MPNQMKLDKILNDVRQKVINHAYIPQKIRSRFSIETREADTTLVLKPQKK